MGRGDIYSVLFLVSRRLRQQQRENGHWQLFAIKRGFESGVGERIPFLFFACESAKDKSAQSVAKFFLLSSPFSFLRIKAEER